MNFFVEIEVMPKIFFVSISFSTLLPYMQSKKFLAISLSYAAVSQLLQVCVS